MEQVLPKASLDGDIIDMGDMGLIKLSIVNKRDHIVDPPEQELSDSSETNCSEERVNEEQVSGGRATDVGTQKQSFIGALKNMVDVKADRRKTLQYYSAGILPFYVKNGMVFFLLGKDTDNKWSDFGGKSEPKDRGRWDYTAAREFYEETIGSVFDISTMILRIRNRKNVLRVDCKSMNNSNYYMYLVRIPYSDAYVDRFKSTLSFMSSISLLPTDRDPYTSPYYKYFEKTDMKWTSLESLETCYPLRSVFRKSLTENYKEIVDFCSRYDAQRGFAYGSTSHILDSDDNWRKDSTVS